MIVGAALSVLTLNTLVPGFGDFAVGRVTNAAISSVQQRRAGAEQERVRSAAPVGIEKK